MNVPETEPMSDNMTREELILYVEDCYGSVAEYPFEKSPSTCVFRHQSNKKWFAVIMEIPKSRLGLSDEGMIDILNVKCDFILINSFLYEKGFFPAYHMNKSNWISVALDNTVFAERIKDLMDISFELTNIKRKRK